MLALAQTAAGTLEADLPASQTTSTLALLDQAPDISLEQESGSSPEVATAVVSTDGVAMDKRVVPDAVIPSLRIVRGGVRLPDNLVDVNAR